MNEFNLEEHHGWGQKSISNLLNSINSRRTVSLDRFISFLGIRYIAQGTAKLLAKHYVSFENWYASMIKLQCYETFSELMSIDTIGEKIAESIMLFFVEEQNVKMLNNLTPHLQILPIEVNTSNSILNNKMIVFTGVLSTLTREEAKTKAEALGAKVSSSISAKTNYLIVGSNPGSKYKKAVELGIEILSEDQWREIISS